MPCYLAFIGWSFDREDCLSGIRPKIGMSASTATTHRKPFKLTWQSIDPAANRYRCFVLRVDEDLWGNPCVVRRWGRIGSAFANASPPSMH